MNLANYFFESNVHLGEGFLHMINVHGCRFNMILT
jgi:hypothetical protein